MATPPTDPPNVTNPTKLPKVTVISNESPIIIVLPKTTPPPKPQGK